MEKFGKPQPGELQTRAEALREFRRRQEAQHSEFAAEIAQLEQDGCSPAGE